MRNRCTGSRGNVTVLSKLCHATDRPGGERLRADGAARLRRSAAPSADICRCASNFSRKQNSKRLRNRANPRSVSMLDLQGTNCKASGRNEFTGTTDFQSVAWCYSTDWKSVVQIADGKFYPAARLKKQRRKTNPADHACRICRRPGRMVELIVRCFTSLK